MAEESISARSLQEVARILFISHSNPSVTAVDNNQRSNKSLSYMRSPMVDWTVVLAICGGKAPFGSIRTDG
jgi:hypothetical protein